MEPRVPAIVSAILIASMWGLSLWAMTVFPANTQVAIHWGPGGVPNNFATVPVAATIGPAIALVASVAFAIMMRFATTVPGRGMPNQRAGMLVVAVIWIVIVVGVTGAHAYIMYSAISSTRTVPR
jgi:hypothetical protein